VVAWGDVIGRVAALGRWVAGSLYCSLAVNLSGRGSVWTLVCFPMALGACAGVCVGA